MVLLDAIAANASVHDPKGMVLGIMAGAAAVGLAAGRKRLDQSTLIYVLLPVPLFLLLSWLAILVFDPTGARTDALDFLALQVASLLLGIVHVRLFYHELSGWRALHWPVQGRNWSWMHFGFTLLLMFMGCIGIMIADVLTVDVERGWNYFPALLCFLVPFLWVKAYAQYTGIPQALYTPWYPAMDYFTYEPHPKFPKVNLRLVFGADMEGEVPEVPFDRYKRFDYVYRWVLHTHLHDQPDTYYTEKDDRVQVWGWHFHRQRTSWFRWNRRIDPARTFKQNRLRDGDTVIALRDPKMEFLDVIRTQRAGGNRSVGP